MPGFLTFPLDDTLKTIVAHARSAPTRKPNYADLYEPDLRRDGKEPADGVFPSADDIDPAKIPHGLWLVKDRGVYLMSPGEPHLPDVDGSKSSMVAYALEANPADEDCYDAARSIMGGDDGCDRLDLEFFEQAIAQGMGAVLVEVSDTSLSLFARP